MKYTQLPSDNYSSANETDNMESIVETLENRLEKERNYFPTKKEQYKMAKSKVGVLYNYNYDELEELKKDYDLWGLDDGCECKSRIKHDNMHDKQRHLHTIKIGGNATAHSNYGCMVDIEFSIFTDDEKLKSGIYTVSPEYKELTPTISIAYPHSGKRNNISLGEGYDGYEVTLKIMDNGEIELYFDMRSNVDYYGFSGYDVYYKGSYKELA